MNTPEVEEAFREIAEREDPWETRFFGRAVHGCADEDVGVTVHYRMSDQDGFIHIDGVDGVGESFDISFTESTASRLAVLLERASTFLAEKLVEAHECPSCKAGDEHEHFDDNGDDDDD